MNQIDGTNNERKQNKQGKSQTNKQTDSLARLNEGKEFVETLATNTALETFYADSEDQHNTRHEQSMGGKETQSTRIEQSCNKQHFHWGAKVCKRWVKCSRQIMRSNSLR